MPIDVSHAGRISSRILIFAVAVVAAQLVAIGRGADREQAKQFYMAGNSLFDQGRFPEAAAAYGRALEQDPKYTDAYYNRALANEMVDRQKSLLDWRRFVEMAGESPDLKWDVARAKARIQILEAKTQLPEPLQSGRYVGSAGDYYREIARTSEGEQWREFPLKVFLSSAPDIKWQQGAREAYDIWRGVLPLQVVAMPDRADIRYGWEESMQGVGHAGEESEWVYFKRVGDQITGRKVAVITVDLSRSWSKDEMRAIFLHELGHALGIKGHSSDTKDIMFFQMQEKHHRVPLPNVPVAFSWKTLPKRPSPRDINTLIRLYNSAGLIERFR